MLHDAFRSQEGPRKRLLLLASLKALLDSTADGGPPADVATSAPQTSRGPASSLLGDHSSSDGGADEDVTLLNPDESDLPAVHVLRHNSQSSDHTTAPHARRASYFARSAVVADRSTGIAARAQQQLSRRMSAMKGLVATDDDEATYEHYVSSVHRNDLAWVDMFLPPAEAAEFKQQLRPDRDGATTETLLRAAVAGDKQRSRQQRVHRREARRARGDDELSSSASDDYGGATDAERAVARSPESPDGARGRRSTHFGSAACSHALLSQLSPSGGAGPVLAANLPCPHCSLRPSAGSPPAITTYSGVVESAELLVPPAAPRELFAALDTELWEAAVHLLLTPPPDVEATYAKALGLPDAAGLGLVPLEAGDTEQRAASAHASGSVHGATKALARLLSTEHFERTGSGQVVAQAADRSPLLHALHGDVASSPPRFPARLVLEEPTPVVDDPPSRSADTASSVVAVPPPAFFAHSRARAHGGAAPLPESPYYGCPVTALQAPPTAATAPEPTAGPACSPTARQRAALMRLRFLQALELGVWRPALDALDSVSAEFRARATAQGLRFGKELKVAQREHRGVAAERAALRLRLETTDAKARAELQRVSALEAEVAAGFKRLQQLKRDALQEQHRTEVRRKRVDFLHQRARGQQGQLLHLTRAVGVLSRRLARVVPGRVEHCLQANPVLGATGAGDGPDEDKCERLGDSRVDPAPGMPDAAQDAQTLALMESHEEAVRRRVLGTACMACGYFYGAFVFCPATGRPHVGVDGSPYQRASEAHRTAHAPPGPVIDRDWLGLHRGRRQRMSTAAKTAESAAAGDGRPGWILRALCPGPGDPAPPARPSASPPLAVAPPKRGRLSQSRKVRFGARAPHGAGDEDRRRTLARSRLRSVIGETDPGLVSAELAAAVAKEMSFERAEALRDMQLRGGAQWAGTAEEEERRLWANADDPAEVTPSAGASPQAQTGAGVPGRPIGAGDAPSGVGEGSRDRDWSPAKSHHEHAAAPPGDGAPIADFLTSCLNMAMAERDEATTGPAVTPFQRAEMQRLAADLRHMEPTRDLPLLGARARDAVRSLPLPRDPSRTARRGRKLVPSLSQQRAADRVLNRELLALEDALRLAHVPVRDLLLRAAELGDDNAALEAELDQVAAAAEAAEAELAAPLPELPVAPSRTPRPPPKAPASPTPPKARSKPAERSAATPVPEVGPSPTARLQARVEVLMERRSALTAQADDDATVQREVAAVADELAYVQQVLARVEAADGADMSRSVEALLVQAQVESGTSQPSNVPVLPPIPTASGSGSPPKARRRVLAHLSSTSLGGADGTERSPEAAAALVHHEWRLLGEGEGDHRPRQVLLHASSPNAARSPSPRGGRIYRGFTNRTGLVVSEADPEPPRPSPRRARVHPKEHRLELPDIAPRRPQPEQEPSPPPREETQLPPIPRHTDIPSRRVGAVVASDIPSPDPAPASGDTDSTIELIAESIKRRFDDTVRSSPNLRHLLRCDNHPRSPGLSAHGSLHGSPPRPLPEDGPVWGSAARSPRSHGPRRPLSPRGPLMLPVTPATPGELGGLLTLSSPHSARRPAQAIQAIQAAPAAPLSARAVGARAHGRIARGAALLPRAPSPTM